MDCRVSVNGRDAGAAFAIGPRLALTARHVMRAATDCDGRPGPEHRVELVPEGHPSRPVTACTSDGALDVAALHVADDVPGWIPVGAAQDDVRWRVAGRPRADDPGLSGRVTFASRVVRNADGHDVPMMQLHVDQQLGDYAGYSGSAVAVADAAAARRPVVVAILVEQVRWRVNHPAVGVQPVANVLYAVPVLDALDRLGLTAEVVQTSLPGGDRRTTFRPEDRTTFRPEDEVLLTRMLRDVLDASDLLDIASSYGPRGRLARRNFPARLPGQGLDDRIRALVEDAVRTSSAHVLVSCIAECRPDLAALLPGPVGASGGA